MPNHPGQPVRDRNLTKAIADGPRLRTDYETEAIARGDGKVLKTGLGAFGIGTMWVGADAYGPDAFADVPYSPDQLDDFGRDGRAA